MKLILKDGVLVFDKPFYKPSGPVRVSMDLPFDSSTHSIYYKVNKRPFKEFKQRFTLFKKDFDRHELVIKIQVVNKETKEGVTYSTNPIPVQQVLHVGELPETQVSASHRALEEKVDKFNAKLDELETKIKTVNEAILELAKKGELL